MRPCERKGCTFPATHRVKFLKNGDRIAVNLCEKHMNDVLLQGLANKPMLRFHIIAVLPFDEPLVNDNE
jgi:hypothetical protein